MARHIEAPLPYLPNEEAQAGHVGRHRNRRGTGWVRRDTSSRNRPGVLDTLQRGPWVAHLPPLPPGPRFGQVGTPLPPSRFRLRGRATLEGKGGTAVNTVHRVWVLGFPERPPDWPAGLPFNPCSPHSLPPGPVVVHPSEVAHFIELARRAASHTESGTLPRAVLYLPPGDSEPPEAAAYFDAVVRADETDRLVRLLTCPHTLSVHEWVEELPREALFGVLEVPWEHRNLPGEAREHLTRCRVCREEFHQALQARRRLLRALCPEPEALARYATGAGAAHLAHHVDRCPACRAELAALQRELGGEPRAVPLKPELRPLWDQVATLLGVRRLPPIAVDLSPLLATLPLAAKSLPETQGPQSLRAQLEGVRCTVQRSPEGLLWAAVEADPQAPRKVRLVLASLHWTQPQEWLVELRPIAPDRLGATLFLGRAEHLEPGAALFLVPEPTDA